jgi:aspartate-semialdehyde dehydrogenase
MPSQAVAAQNGVANSSTTLYSPERRIRVGIVGATGAVGQRFIQLLEQHPWFSVAVVAASKRSAGKAYKDAAKWVLETDVPTSVSGLRVVSCDDASVAEWAGDVDVVFSALDSCVATQVESACLVQGLPVFSNAKNYRTHPAAPLVVPPVNAAHLAPFLQWQADSAYWSQALPAAAGSAKAKSALLVTNANCSTTGLVTALAPLQESFGIDHVSVVTLQAISGAGYPGVSAWDLASNVVPNINGEEHKIETEFKKILGTVHDPSVTSTVSLCDMQEAAATQARSGGNASPLLCSAGCTISAHTNRVPVLTGHTLCVTVALSSPASVQQVLQAFKQYRPEPAHVMAALPSTPRDTAGAPQWIRVRPEADRPQPAKDVHEGGGYATVVGQVRACKSTPNGIKFTVVSHNTIMGAAGSSILNAEAAVRMGYLKPQIERCVSA